MLYHWNLFELPKCPNCDHLIEKSSHVLRCNHQKAKTEFKSKGLEGIKKCLSEAETYNLLQTSILRILKDWRDCKPITPAL